MKRYLHPHQKDALDEQDKRLGLGRHESVLCSDGKWRPRWQVQMFAAERQAATTLRDKSLSRGRFV